MNRIWTNGCFDIIHAGHIELFKYAKSLGQYLYVGIDNDYRVKKLKGDKRPINNEILRKSVLSAIKYIDGIEIFSSDNELEDAIKKLNIDTIVVGDDYKNKSVIGSNFVENVIFFPKIQNLSSSFIYESTIN